MMNIVDFWHMHTPIISILIPAFTGFLLLFLGHSGKFDANSTLQPWRRILSYTATILGLITAIDYVIQANTGRISVYELSEWTAPFGIVLVLDRLSAFMVLLTYLLAMPVLWFSSQDWDIRGRYFHALFQFLLMGLCGAFLTGDLFNLFVFFEILLMSSYVLLIYGQGKARFQLGIHYVVINLFASAVFLTGLGLIYASVGSLNMTDVARILPTLHPDQLQLATIGGYLLFIVFAIKAAIVPLGFWLPKTYAVASTPVAALFTIMTKVGIYAILRVNALAFVSFGHTLFFDLLLILGLISSLYGAIVAMGAVRLRRFVGFMILSSLGTILTGLALNKPAAWAAALYYLLHSTIIGAAFYLFCGWLTAGRGEFKDHLRVAPQLKQEKVLSICFFLIALMMAGLPPFSGFLGKVFLLQATQGHPYQVWIIAVVLLVSLFSIIAFVRAGFILFWQSSEPEDNPKIAEYQSYQALPATAPARNDTVVYILLGFLVLYVGFTKPIQEYLAKATEQLSYQQIYQYKILKQNDDDVFISTEPFNPKNIPETKYGGENPDPNAHLIPYLISEKTMAGHHISDYKKRQIEQQNKQPETNKTVEKQHTGAKLKSMEP